MAATWIALLRAIGGKTHKAMSMAQLREGCAKAGLGDPRTVLAKGNLIVAADWPKARVLQTIEDVVTTHGLTIGPTQPLNNAVILRRPPDVARVLDRPAFPVATRDRPDRVLIVFLDRTPDPNRLDALQKLAGTERLHLAGSHLNIDYNFGVGTSKLTAKAIERHLNCTGTARNWNTVGKLLDAARVNGA